MSLYTSSRTHIFTVFPIPCEFNFYKRYDLVKWLESDVKGIVIPVGASPYGPAMYCGVHHPLLDRVDGIFV